MMDPYLEPQTTLRSRLARGLWNLCNVLFFRFSPRPFHAWRALLLRCFGARLGSRCHIYPGARIWAPWNLQCLDVATIADGAQIYNAWPVRIGSHAIVSQDAYICTAGHDIDDPDFPMTGAAVDIGDYAWICARAAVLPGVAVGTGAVLALGAIASRSLDPWTLYAGMPARPVRARKQPVRLNDGSEELP